MILNKYFLDSINKDDILLSKFFFFKKKINIKFDKLFIDIRCLFKQNLSNRSNSKIYMLFLSFFNFWLFFLQFKIIKGNNKKLIFLQFLINIQFSFFFLSNFYYYNKIQNLNIFSYSKINVFYKQFYIIFYFIFFKSFLNIYINNDILSDIIEENYHIIIKNRL